MTEVKDIQYIKFNNGNMAEINSLFSQGYELQSVSGRVDEVCIVNGKTTISDYACLVLYSSS